MADQPEMMVGRPDDARITEEVLAPLWERTRRGWWWLLAISGAGVVLLIVTVTYTLWMGPGVWGTNIPVAWAYPIINFVWWIGIGHAGTFISAFLVLLNQRWRSSINRVAEAMTLFALVNAGLFPLLHLGRPWFFYWLLPYPTRFQVWPQYKSTLPWDVAAVSTYFLVSLLFWYLGLVPDFATARDRAPTRFRRRVYGVFALGWRGAAEQWQRHRITYLLLAGLATPLVISVHSVVSLDFAIALLPGWHSAIFPPYFVVGAIFSGLGMVLVLLLPVRAVFKLKDLITDAHLDALAKLILVTGWMLTYSYVIESFLAWYSGDLFERYTYLFARPFGAYAWVYWSMTAVNVLVPQLFWWKRLRRNPVVLFIASLLIVLAMWAERFVIIVTSEYHDFLPSSWHFYAPTWVDWGILLGSVGLFVFLFLLFLRFVPAIPLGETKKLRYQLEHEEAR
ncbi:MAG TPA: NrfD/PsrC family molybdoenzyme membrane anchor subunit [Longimicrobiaceae bacterium]|nr:NrfD/PsrC family molybdoenzyme membrane anchor subunit [Longimicrobiaceae bacterium]